MARTVRGRSWYRPGGDRVYGGPFRYNRQSLLVALYTDIGLDVPAPGGGPEVPANALLTEDGQPLLTESGEIITT